MLKYFDLEYAVIVFKFQARVYLEVIIWISPGAISTGFIFVFSFYSIIQNPSIFKLQTSLKFWQKSVFNCNIAIFVPPNCYTLLCLWLKIENFTSRLVSIDTHANYGILRLAWHIKHQISLSYLEYMPIKKRNFSVNIHITSKSNA